MALPTFVAVGTPGEGTSDVVPGLPAGWQQNDIFLLAVEQADTPGATPSGWTAFSERSTATAPATGLELFWRRATSSESAPTVADRGNHAYAVITAWRGCPTTGDPYDVTGGGVEGIGTTVSVNSITTTVVDTLDVIHVAHGLDQTTGVFSNWANAGLANLTERFNDSTDQGNGGGIGIISGEKATAGAVGATTADVSTTCSKAFISVALKGATGGGTTPVSDTLQIIHDVRTAVSDTMQVVYDVRAGVSDTLQLVHDVAAYVSDTLGIQYDVRAAVEDTLQVLFDVRSAVEDDLEIVHDVRAFVSDDLELLYDIAGPVSDELQLIWDVAGPVTDTLQILYDVRAAIADTLQVIFDVRAGVSDTLAIQFDLAAYVSDSLEIQHGLGGVLTKDLSIVYSILIHERAYVEMFPGSGILIPASEHGRRRR